MGPPLKDQLHRLKDFSACDVSDALLKLQKPAPGEAARGGYLADIVPFAPSSPFLPNLAQQPKIIAQISTLRLIDKSDQIEPLPIDDQHSVPEGSHWADETEPDTILVIEQPEHQTCAAVGGIMASRMRVRGLQGCIVGGRIRDLAELKKTDLPVRPPRSYLPTIRTMIWARGRSTVGSGAESKPYARNVKITINDVAVSPGDIAFCDPLEGVVIIPHKFIDQVLELMPKLVAADDKVKEDVEAGSTVHAAFHKHRT